MYYKDIICKDCGKVLAKLNQTVVANVESTTLCYACASVRYSNIKRGTVVKNKSMAS